MRLSGIVAFITLGITFAALLQAGTTQELALNTNAMDGAYESKARDHYMSLKVINWVEALGSAKPNTVALAEKVLTNTGCQGIVAGFAVSTKRNQLTFDQKGGSGDECRLVLNFTEDRNGGIFRVQIEEQGCGSLHGMHCSFSGVLKRATD